MFMYLELIDKEITAGGFDYLNDDREFGWEIDKVIELMGVEVAREIDLVLATRSLPVQQAIWSRIAQVLAELDRFIDGEQKRAFIEHNFAMLRGDNGVAVDPCSLWTYPDGYTQYGNYHEFYRGASQRVLFMGHVDTLGVVMLKYIYDVEAKVPYCLIDHVQGVRQSEDDISRDPFFEINPLERMAEHVIRGAIPLLNGGWKLALKADDTFPMLKRDSPFSFGVRDRFFESKPKKISAKGADMPGVALPSKLYELNPNRRRVKEILGA